MEPVSRRTRLRTEEFFKLMHEELRKKQTLNNRQSVEKRTEDNRNLNEREVAVDEEGDNDSSDEETSDDDFARRTVNGSHARGRVRKTLQTVRDVSAVNEDGRDDYLTGKEKNDGDASGRTRKSVQNEKCSRSDKRRKKNVSLTADNTDGSCSNESGRERKRCSKKQKHMESKFEKILASSILNNVEGSCSNETGRETPSSPKIQLKFKFPAESPPKLSTKDEEFEELWKEMAFALDELEASKVDTPGLEAQKAVEHNATVGCRMGEHILILDNEIGFYCKYCYHVELKIKYCVPNRPGHEAGKTVEHNVAGHCDMGRHTLVLDEQIGLICKNCPYIRQEIKRCIPRIMRHPSGNGRNYRKEKKKTCSNPVTLQEIGVEDEDPNVKFKGTVWNMIPDLKSLMHPHQVEGFEFLWRNIGGGLDLNDLKGQILTNRGSGCIISHAPGTGKTFLAAAFLSSYFKVYPFSRPVIVAPSFMLKNWESEFNKWNIGVHLYNLNNGKLDGNESDEALKLDSDGVRSLSVEAIRLIKLFSWDVGKGALAISYKLFEELTGREMRRSSCYAPSGNNVWEALLQRPGLLILDEGHTPRNNRSCIWRALASISTGKKIILSGTPFQNNFDELFNLLSLLRPEYAQESNARDHWLSLTGRIQNSANGDQHCDGLAKLREMLDPFVHTYKGNILKERLPGLVDSVIVLVPSEMQRTLLEKLDRTLKDQVFLHQCAVTVGSIHPYLLSSKFSPEDVDVDHAKLQSVELDPECGVKTKFLMELMRLCELLNEKVLVFSQYIDPLKLICRHLQSRLGWVVGNEILIMHGQCLSEQRQSVLQKFNDPKSSSKAMLASTRACSEGISMVGASRVVFLDVVWNPSVDKQAVSRAYRLGQQKVVYVYHLLAAGTIEEEKFRCQAIKDRLSELVFCSSDGPNSVPSSASYSQDKADKVLERLVQCDKLQGCVKSIVRHSR